ncbi:MAG: ATP-binding cassette domain-containing protein [Myxococcales bacterium]|nr:ATP-binding cassette domain-containing protein [Myxococcales bacterium]
MIDVENLALGFGETVILENLNFSVQRGEVFVILGGSGSGKTTLLKCLVGLLQPLRGSVRIEGATRPGLNGEPPSYGVLFQSGALFSSLSVLDNVRLPLEKWTDLDDAATDAIARSKLRLVGLEGFEAYLPAELSGGMKKRAGIARALALESPLLFLDEPSAGLDPVTAVELDELILTLNSSLGMTMVIVTHELESIFKITSSCIMLDREAKGIIAQGDPRELREHASDQRVLHFFNRTSPGA